MAISGTTNDSSEEPVGRRIKVGIVLFGLALIPYRLLMPFIFNYLPASTITMLIDTGVILSKALFISAIAVLGKSGFTFLKKEVFSKFAPADEVGPVRYRIGLVMFTVPILRSLLESYPDQADSGIVESHLWVDIVMDIVLFASVFVLGGNFWDKIRALFIRDAYVAASK